MSEKPIGYTWFQPKQKPGARAGGKRKDIEILAEIKGVVVHDHSKPYYQLQDINHALCNAHHLLELKAIEEIEQESWAKSMNKLLRLAGNYKHRYPKGLPKNIVSRMTQLYEQIIQRGLRSHSSNSTPEEQR
ncbi:MAG: transposase [Coleofasciculaceae cyanobacterium]